MRYHATSEGNVPFTAEEESQRDAEELAFSTEVAKLLETKYKSDRAAEYPPMLDYLDGIVKGDTTQVQTYIDACLNVKSKYPKP